MKKTISLALAFLLACSPSFAAWDVDAPAGSDLVSTIDTTIGANNAALEATLTDMRGWKNLKVVRTNVTTVTVTADELWLQKASDLARNFSSVSEAIAITTAGAGGLDTGAEGDVWYYIWIIAKDDNTIDGLLSASATNPTMPAGYTYKTLVSAVKNTSGNFVGFIQCGFDYGYVVNPTSYTGSPGAGWVSVDISSYVPSSLSTRANFILGAGTSQAAWLSNNSADSTASGTNAPNKINQTSQTAVNPQYATQLDIVTADTVYIGGSAAVILYISGFNINKLF